METTYLLAKRTCSLCRKIYTDPVLLKCGHSFCRLCINYLLDSHLVFGEYFCPICKKKLKERPLLLSNTKILHAVQTHQAVQRGEHTEEEDKVYCLYCEDSQVPAVKTCVQCESPLCDLHLKLHNKKLNHILIPPTAKKCNEHNKLLRYYCSQDAAVICESCGCLGNHCGHECMSVKDAFHIKKKKLHSFLRKLKVTEGKIDSKMQRIGEVTSQVRQQTKALGIKMNDLFKELSKQLNSLQKKMKGLLFNRLHKISRQTKYLHNQKETLSRKICHVKKLCNITDPVALLQKELDKNLFHDGPDEETVQDDDPIPSFDDPMPSIDDPNPSIDDPIPSIDDLLKDPIKASLFKGLSDLVTEHFKQYDS